jgi:hypothetical protein
VSTNKYYEAHITMSGDSADYVETYVKNRKWKFSKIDGDANLGTGVKCYATKQYNGNKDRDEILADLHLTANVLSQHCTILRRKIELVIYDDRSNTVRFNCDGSCPECNTSHCSSVGRAHA